MKIFDSIPIDEPSTELLQDINSPEDLRKLNQSQIPKLADELREFLLYTVGKTGGHFGAGLGVIELTLALHYKFQGNKQTLDEVNKKIKVDSSIIRHLVVKYKNLDTKKEYFKTENK